MYLHSFHDLYTLHTHVLYSRWVIFDCQHRTSLKGNVYQNREIFNMLVHVCSMYKCP